jgi:hypothetical protein
MLNVMGCAEGDFEKGANDRAGNAYPMVIVRTVAATG